MKAKNNQRIRRALNSRNMRIEWCDKPIRNFHR